MEALAGLDWILLALAAVSVVVGTVRGLVREALSLVIWVVALIMAALFAERLSIVLAEWIATETLRFPIAFGGVFLISLLLGALLARLIGMLVDATGLTGLDRVLGTAFGLLRAGVVGVVVVAMTDPLFGEAAWWRASLIVPHLLAAQDATFAFLQALLDAVSAPVSA